MVPGVLAGVLLRCSGVVSVRAHQPVIYNPRYEIVPQFFVEKENMSAEQSSTQPNPHANPAISPADNPGQEEKQLAQSLSVSMVQICAAPLTVMWIFCTLLAAGAAWWNPLCLLWRSWRCSP